MGTTMVRKTNKIAWEQSTQMAALGLRHGVTCRTGGVSQDEYGSLNLALHVGDSETAVLENRRRLCSAVGIDMHRLTTSQQTHEDHVVAVSEQEAGRGADHYDDALAHTDALMTNCPGIPLMILTADCVPVILYDPIHQACAVVHDGWRGTAAKLAAKTVLAMRIAYGSQPESMLAYIGPSISVAHFEVGDEAIDAFTAMGPVYAPCFHLFSGKRHIDLWAANRLMLEEAGLQAAHIDVTDSCCYDHNTDFFSSRRDAGKTGRMGTFVVL